jgi:hypothetical protein
MRSWRISFAAREILDIGKQNRDGTPFAADPAPLPGRAMYRCRSSPDYGISLLPILRSRVCCEYGG